MVEVTDSSSVSTTEKASQKCEAFFCFYITTTRKAKKARGQDAQAIKKLGGYPSILTSIFRRRRPRHGDRGDILNYLAAAESVTTTLAAESAGMATAAGSAIVSAGAATSAGFA